MTREGTARPDRRPCSAAWRRRQNGGGQRLGPGWAGLRRGRSDSRQLRAPASALRQAALRVATAQTAAGGRGGTGNKDAIMSLPCDCHSRSPRRALKRKWRAGRPRRGGAGPAAGTRAGATPQPTACQPWGSRWTPGRASAVASDATSWHPRQRAYLYLPGPFPPPSWCGARRLGDAHHKPCGTREPGLEEEFSSWHRGPPAPVSP